MRTIRHKSLFRLWTLGASALLAVVAVTPTRAGAQAPATPRHPATSAETPFAVEYYYKVKWGFAEEFARLFAKNHLPILKKQIESGRILEIEVEKPRYHATEEGRWDYRVTLVFRNAAAAADASGEEALKKQLFPDQESYAREEQRRFEILLAHWDLPIVPAPEMGR